MERWRTVIKIRVLKKVFSKSALSDAEDSIGPSNRRDIADFTLLKTQLAIRQKWPEPRFWELSFLFYFSKFGCSDF